ncbi:MAG TPA: DUF6629 family protein [Acidimicrobiales bacterium]|nr:DUF6629 family protein [Acidimicrobiales bacterium]
MCFSPQGDLIGGAVVTVIGIDAFRQTAGRTGHLLLGGLPLLLGAHQIDESLVWWSLQGHVSAPVGRLAMWIYLVIALLVVPVLVPVAILRLEPTWRRRWRIAPFVTLGLGVAGALLEAMVRGPVTVTMGSYHLAYSIALRHGIVIVSLYVVATCGALLASSYRHIVLFGVVNLVAVAVLARLTADGFASLWCFYAAVASGAIWLHMRFARNHRAHPYALT